jgi:hypothetical protein
MTNERVLYSGPQFSPMFEDGMFRYRVSAPVIKPLVDLSFTSRVPFTPNRDRFDVSGDYKLFSAIVDDMRQHAGILEPTAHWHNENAGRLSNGRENLAAPILYELDANSFEERYGTLQQMLNSYIGGHGMTTASPSDIEEYRRFVYAIDHLGLTGFDLDEFCRTYHALVTDLGSLLDVNAILGFVLPSDQNMIHILEIGAGYGRLAEVCHNILAGRCRYTIADSVPASLMFSYEYLRRQLPNASIGSFYAGDSFSDNFDIFIVPSWELKNIVHRWDAVVAIEAFQEMNNAHVEFYTDYMENSIDVGGLAYISGSWRYANQDAYEFSNKMQTLWLGNTPRSWTYVHPTHILRKGTRDFSRLNRIMLEHYSLNCS